MTRWILLGLLTAGLAGAVQAGEGCAWKKGAKAEKAGGCEKAACGAEKKSKSAKVNTIDTAALQQKITAGDALTIVDARSAKWDDGKRLPGAISVSAESTDEQIAAALPDKAASIITYCSNEKCPASQTLAERLIGLGYTSVVKYPQGIEAWTEAGHDIVDTRAAKPGQS